MPPIPTTLRRPGSASELVERLLRENPEGLTGPQLRDALRSIPEAPKSLLEHGQYIYNVLAPMIGKGEVLKTETGIYRLSADPGAKEKS